MENDFAANIVGVLVGLPFIILVIMQFIKDSENKKECNNCSNKNNSTCLLMTDDEQKKFYGEIPKGSELYAEVKYDGSPLIITYIVPRNIKLEKGKRVLVRTLTSYSFVTVINAPYVAKKNKVKDSGVLPVYISGKRDSKVD